MSVEFCVLFHGRCWDGFAAAWSAWLSLGNTAEYIPVQYGADPPWDRLRGRGVYILDFCYSADVLRQIAKLTDDRLVTVLDHHKTSEVVAEMAEAGELGNRIRFVFDESRSGGQLAWALFHKSRSSPWLVDYTEDSDLWRWALPNSRQINACLRSYPLDFHKWSWLAKIDPYSLVEGGEAILRAEQVVVDQHARYVREVNFLGRTVPAVNATTLVSEIGAAICQGRQFGVTFSVRQDGKISVSLRSDKNGEDVSAIAKELGGGGHKHAAGFELGNLGELMALLPDWFLEKAWKILTET